ncbi:MAG: metallopeptidase family protein [Syntrophaceae bacterium]
MKLRSGEFDKAVRNAISRIPPEFRDHLENIVISVQDRPSKDLLEETGLPPDNSLLGIYRGDSLMNRSVTIPPLFPDTIFIFQEPLEAMCADLDELEEQIAITVIHEIAHYLGMDEDQLRELGYE